MKWLKRMLIVLAALVAVALALPFFISLDDFIPRIEKEASARLKQPVSIRSIGFALLPLPHVTVEGITAGTAGDIRLGTVTVTPDLYSLLQPTRVIRRLEIDDLVLTRKAIDRMPARAKPDAAPSSQRAPPQVRVESIRLNNALVNFGKTSLGPFDARVDLDGQGEPEEASIATRDGKLKVLIKADDARYLIDASAKSWTLPVGPALAFDELIVKGAATPNDLNLGELSARLYGGTASGKATLGWEKGLRLAGNLDLGRVELQQLAAVLARGTRVSGKLSAKPVFSASAAAADQLMDALRLETDFSVENGALHGVDIQQAATNLMRKGATGGVTRFEQLSGHLAMERGGYRFTQLRIASGALAAEGNVSISPKKELSGRINAQVQALGASANVPLNVAGTTDAPLLYPTGATVAGAAAGTAVMGPGFGTSVGATVGGWVDGLFGKSDGKKPDK